MEVKKAIAYETECPSCLSLIRFERHEIKMGGCDNYGTITCPACRYEINVAYRTSLYGYEIELKERVRPIYEEKEQPE